MKVRSEHARREVAERFWEKVDRSNGPLECWDWTASIATNGYGQFQLRYRTHRAHRMAWVLTFGAIPEGLLACHRCDNRRCCNPAHMFLGTAKENTQDMVGKGRAKGAQGEDHRNARLTADLVRQIRSAHGTNKEIADRFSVSSPHVSNIRSGKKWKHIALIA